MRVETLGEGEPEVAVVGGIHGDEPCGPAAVDELLEADLEIDRPAKLVVANEEALSGDVRYIDEDLNRAFPGAPDADTHEGRLAHQLLTELRGCQVLSLHSTQSYAEPFAIAREVTGYVRSVCSYLSVEALVETTETHSVGRLLEKPRVLEVECGLQQSETATSNAARLCREYLVATGVITGEDEPPRHHPMPVFRLEQRLSKPTAGQYDVFVRNFERVAEGERFAAVDGEDVHADRPFYPVLLSAYGYENVFGYAGDLVGRLDDEAPATATGEDLSAAADVSTAADRR